MDDTLPRWQCPEGIMPCVTLLRCHHVRDSGVMPSACLANIVPKEKGAMTDYVYKVSFSPPKQAYYLSTLRLYDPTFI